MTLRETEQIIDLTPYPRPALLKAEQKEEACEKLLRFLLRERGMIAAFSATYEKKRTLVRGYMNERAALPVPADILALQDQLFWTESVERGIVEPDTIAFNQHGIGHYQGDIARLSADAIVNAANSALLGCFRAGHNCIDNVIHSAAGMQLRDDCAKLIAAQQSEEPCGDAKITRAYNLPAKYVLHTVGPLVLREVTQADRAALRSCYLSCLDLCEEAGIRSVAFCCIATGVFNFPREEAAEIATGTVLNWKLRRPDNKLKVIFNTFLDADAKIYDDILRMM